MYTQYNNAHLVIMAGGSGQRFWPLSTTDLPKQFHDFLGIGKTLLQATAERFEELIPHERIWVVTHTRYAAKVKEQLPWISNQQILCEPLSKNTAPCIAYACQEISKTNPEAVLIFTPADHHIEKKELFVKALHQALEFDSCSITLLGIPPTTPETGYGYIGYDNREKGAIKVVNNFIEKPPKEQAQFYLEQGNYLWNTGIFIGKIDAFVKNFRTYLSKVWNGFEQNAISQPMPNDTQGSLENLYKSLPSISFDESILEKTKDLHVVICEDFRWTDLGNWHALYQHLDKDKYGNIFEGQIVTLDSHNCLIKTSGKKLVAALGIDNLVVVQHKDIVLICPQDKVQDLKKLLKKLEDEGYEEYL